MEHHNQKKEEQMRMLVAQFDKSGLSINAFCKSTGTSYPILRYWRRKFATPSSIVPSTGFREIKVVPPAALMNSDIVMETSNGITVRFPADYSVEALAGLISRL